jgi:hypothetical protein
MSLSIEFGPFANVELIFRNMYGVKCTMGIDEPYMFSKGEWIDFLECITNDKKYALCFCDSNGEVRLSYKPSTDDCDGLIQYTVSKYGSGGDGGIIMSFEKSEYYDDFVCVINTLLKKDDIWKDEEEEEDEDEEE